MPQVPFSEVPVGARFLAPVSILGEQDILYKKASQHEGIPSYEAVNGWPIFRDEDKDSFNHEETVVWPPSDIWTK